MMKCPYCKELIDDDSYYCDQCGKEMRFCPECGKPKQGTVCAACGADLVSAKEFHGNPGQPSFLVGNGWRLPLKPGVFGRIGGIYPEFSTEQYISGRHGEIFHNKKGEWGISDLDSTNGTFIDGIRLEPHKAYLLKIGQQLTIATTNFMVE